MKRVLAGEFSNDIEEFHILDCRYPYEFEGGHIQVQKHDTSSCCVILFTTLSRFCSPSIKHQYENQCYFYHAGI